ncbi:MAG TPA: hypothetical protein ENG01_00360 [Candidatus Aenigmarchaeota archaeon]|nr:hypothetical protein [Candidatus Aenigmarchaeota archaeon]HEX32849.1 hypothetical protein [Candidatus Aenigmarchaeota archaeon]
MRKQTLVLISSIIIGIIVYAYFLISYNNITDLAIGAVIAIIISIGPYSIIKYMRLRLLNEIEKAFPNFLNDLSESIRAGMPLTGAIKLASKANYGPLSEEIKKMAIKISWGVPFIEVMNDLKNKYSDSVHLTRMIAIVTDAYRSGGKLDETLDYIAEAARSILNMERERRSAMKEQTLVIYIIFFVFIAIIIALYNIMIPITSVNTQALTGGATQPVDLMFYKVLFFAATVIQAIATGVLSGVVTDGKVTAGLRTSLILVVVALVVFAVYIFPEKIYIDLTPLTYTRYVPGQLIEVQGKATIEGKPLGGADVTVICENNKGTGKTDADGFFRVNVNAPKTKGDNTCYVEVSYDAYSAKSKFSITIV